MGKHRSKNFLIPSLLLGLASAGNALALDRVAIVSEGAATSAWRPAPGVAQAVAAYPASLPDQTRDACVSIGFLLNKDGSTSDFSLLKTWSASIPDSAAAQGQFDPFAQNAQAAVQQWRFVPAKGGSTKLKPIYTAATFAFTSNPALDKEALRSHCLIADLPEFVARAQAKAYKRGNLNKAKMEHERAQYPPEIPFGR